MNNKLKQKANVCFDNQNRRCYTKNNPRYKDNGAKGIRVEYTRQEFVNWYLKNYPSKKDKWSVGRIDHSKSYSLDNIRFETLAENSMERILRVGTTKPRRKIIIHDCISGEDVFIAESAAEAAKLTGIDRSHVRKYCLGYCRRSAKGFSLRYLNETRIDKKSKYKPKSKKKILVFGCNNKLFCIAYGSADASRKTGVHASHIARYCAGYLKKSKNGYSFKWA